ncbi:MAG: hypothetical protein AAFQ52_20190 [Chloroflexota bacterium]
MKRLLLILLLLISGVVVAQEDATEDDVVLYRDSIPAADTLTFETVASNLMRPRCSTT